MPLIKSRRISNQGRRSSQAALLPHQVFPGNIRNELRMTCVLRGFSSLREGFGKNGLAQQEALFDFYHGKGDKIPSQIQMLADGISAYKDLYDIKDQTIVVKKGSKKKKVTRKKLQLKKSLCRDEFMTYTAGDQINTKDLKKNIVI